jgi:hypothetical protein
MNISIAKSVSVRAHVVVILRCGSLACLLPHTALLPLANHLVFAGSSPFGVSFPIPTRHIYAQVEYARYIAQYVTTKLVETEFFLTAS